MNIAKANHHHTLAGFHLGKGDVKKAAHHLGHALFALRANTGVSRGTPDVPKAPDEGEPNDNAAEEASEYPTTTTTGPMSLKARLSKMRGC